MFYAAVGGYWDNVCRYDPLRLPLEFGKRTQLIVKRRQYLTESRDNHPFFRPGFQKRIHGEPQVAP